MLRAPFLITLVTLFVTPDRPGIYVLYRDLRQPAYVGRSDKDLRSRIVASAEEHPGVRWFSFEYADSIRDVYPKECCYYHELRLTDKVLHPSPPAFTGWDCPVCTADRLLHVLRALGRGGIR